MMNSHLPLSRKQKPNFPYEKSEIGSDEIIQSHNLKWSPFILLCFYSIAKYLTCLYQDDSDVRIHDI